jgi:antitoxin component HigA of HigAB toxin-antitoxin module
VEELIDGHSYVQRIARGVPAAADSIGAGARPHAGDRPAVDGQAWKTAAEKEIIELLSTLVDQYEESRWPTPHASPGEVLKFLMAERQLSQLELARQAAVPQSTIANVIAGRRQLSKANVLGLGKFFSVSPTLFME